MSNFEEVMNRRNFLRGSSLLAAAVVAAPLAAFAQQVEPTKPDVKKDEPSEAKPDQPPTLKDAQGREYRICPQCGYNMYKQENTWTCENCGYSYVE